MLDFFNSLLGIIASLLAIVGLGGASYTIVTRIKIKKNQKLKGDGFNNASEGENTIVKGNTIAKGEEALNIVGNNNQVIQQFTHTPYGSEEATTPSDLKLTCQILFIDDKPLPILIKTLRKSGWKNVKRIGDTANLDIVEIRNADIIFIDILGVGLKLGFKNEGVGLAAAIKRKYQKQKGVIIYSATPDHNLFDPDIKVVDDRLPKNAEPIQFSNMIEKYGKPKN